MHLPNSLDNFVDNNFEDSFGTFADSMKATMFQKVQHIFNLLDFEDDQNFLEPLFFLKVGYNPAPLFSFEQIQFGYIDNKLKPELIQVLSSNKGVVFLPRLGYLTTSALSQSMEMHYNRETGAIKLKIGDQIIAHEFVPVKTLCNSNIELEQYNNPLNDDNFGTKDNPQIVDIEQGFKDHCGHVEKAMEIIKNEYPWYFSYIEKAVKRIVVFYNDQVRSFASRTTTGISYISAEKEYNEVFFLEDITHQCAHNILYLITVQMQDFFAVDAKNGLISEYNKDGDDRRTIYSAYHGTFSLVNISTLLARILQKEIFEGHKRHELVGRFSDNLKRLGKNISDIKYKEIYADKGWELLMAIEDRYKALIAEYGSFIEKYDTSRQPYSFDYSIFLEDNPL